MTRINPFRQVVAYRYGTKLETVTATGNPIPVKKLNADEYMDSNGNIKKFKKSETRADGISSVGKTLKRLRRLISANFNGGSSELWVTLTYAENVTDTSVVYQDFKNFMKKLRRKYAKNRSLEYINVLEPQRRGAWHMHLLIKTDDGSHLRVENDDMRRLWGKGFVKVKRLKDTDNVSAYLMAYLTDIELKEGETGSEHVKVKEGKRYEKGGRLHMYPSGMNFYRCSRGIEQPKKHKGTKEQIYKNMGYDLDDIPDPFYYKRLTIDIGGSARHYEFEIVQCLERGDNNESDGNKTGK